MAAVKSCMQGHASPYAWTSCTSEVTPCKFQWQIQEPDKIRQVINIQNKTWTHLLFCGVRRWSSHDTALTHHSPPELEADVHACP